MKQECIPVECVPSAAVTAGGCLPRGCVSAQGGCLPRGVCVQGECLPGRGCRGGVCPGCVCVQGVCVQGGAGGCLPSGVAAPVHAGIPPPGQNDRCLWKFYLATTMLRTVKKFWMLYFENFVLSFTAQKSIPLHHQWRYGDISDNSANFIQSKN